MSAEESWVIAMRAEALAKLTLTQHPDVDIVVASDSSPQAGYDLMVRINDGDIEPAPEFAIEVKGTKDALSPRRLEDIAAGLRQRLSDVGMPLCLFVFQVDTKEGWYRWLYEPVVSPGRAPRLVPTFQHEYDDAAVDAPIVSRQSRFERLDDDAIDQIVQQVVQWSRERSGVLAGS